MTAPPDIQDQICAILREQANVEVPSTDFDLIESGVMDSLTFVDMLFQIEQRFSVSLDIENLDLDDIRSVDRIGQTVASRMT
jgi:acyl carrier protein